jgi:hypothetical protein
VLAIGLKVRRFKPGRGDGFLRAIKIRSTPSFGGELVHRLPVSRFYDMAKIPAEYYRDTTSAKFKNLSHKLPASLLGVTAAIRELWCTSQE